MSTYLPEVQLLLSGIFMQSSLNCLWMVTLRGTRVHRLEKVKGRGSIYATMGMPSSMLDGDFLV